MVTSTSTYDSNTGRRLNRSNDIAEVLAMGVQNLDLARQSNDRMFSEFAATGRAFAETGVAFAQGGREFLETGRDFAERMDDLVRFGIREIQQESEQ